MISNIKVYEDKVEFVVELWVSQVKNHNYIEDIKKILPDSHFLIYNEEFDHGVKLHLVDMSGMNKTPETILEYLESFIKEAKSII